MNTATKPTEYSVTKVRPSRALNLLPLLQDFELGNIEVIHNEAVNSYIVPLNINDFLERASKAGHTYTELNEIQYVLLCFGREPFNVVASGERTVVLL